MWGGVGWSGVSLCVNLGDRVRGLVASCMQARQAHLDKQVLCKQDPQALRAPMSRPAAFNEAAQATSSAVAQVRVLASRFI